MNVKELRDWLEELEDDMRIVFRPENSDYVEVFDDASARIVNLLDGGEYVAVVIHGTRVGTV